jgi:SHS2 domain-containing protein
VSTPKADAERGFRALEHTADRAIEAWAPELGALFCEAALGMFAESASCAHIEPEQQWSLQVEADSLEGLLHAWLSELLWVAEREEAEICLLEMEEIQQAPYRARGRARGGPPPADTPHTGAPAKAVTYHELKVWQEEDTWRATVVFDV